MKPRRPATRKTRDDYHHKRDQLISERSALIVTMALLVAVGGAGLLHAAHQPAAMVAFTAVAIFAGSLRLFSDLVD
jgi:hypothetical protein